MPRISVLTHLFGPKAVARVETLERAAGVFAVLMGDAKLVSVDGRPITVDTLSAGIGDRVDAAVEDTDAQLPAVDRRWVVDQLAASAGPWITGDARMIAEVSRRRLAWAVDQGVLLGARDLALTLGAGPTRALDAEESRRVGEVAAVLRAMATAAFDSLAGEASVELTAVTDALDALTTQRNAPGPRASGPSPSDARARRLGQLLAPAAGTARDLLGRSLVDAMDRVAGRRAAKKVVFLPTSTPTQPPLGPSLQSTLCSTRSPNCSAPSRLTPSRRP